MSCFTIKNSFWLVFPSKYHEKFKKIYKFIIVVTLVCWKIRKNYYDNLFNFPTALLIYANRVGLSSWSADIGYIGVKV